MICTPVAKELPIGRAVKILRAFNGVTQKETAKGTDLSQAYLCEIEGGLKDPSIDTLQKLADYFNLTLSQLIKLAEDVKGNA